MKYLFFFLAAGCFFACTSTDKPATNINNRNLDSLAKVAMSDTASFTTIEWLDSLHTNLGKITEGQVVEVTWNFKNTGDKPLIIQNVQPGCGCTIADKPEAPVAPGESSSIKAKFNSEGQHIGHVDKSITVQANTKGGTAHYLSFSAEINK